ncbi:hypothetical protein NL529_29795, partial [Klebsiella pneumoniae]|nr:hypothetical protein [Klebsiella pneumoniae]
AGTLRITGVTDLDTAGYQKDDVIYVWQENSGNSRSPSQRLTVDSFPDATTIQVNETIADFAAPVRIKHVKGVALSGSIPAGSNTVTLA